MTSSVSHGVDGLLKPVQQLSLWHELRELSPQSRSKLGWSVALGTIAVILWLYGMVVDSLSILAYSYLVAFDAVGLVVLVIGSVLRTSTTLRLKTLSNPFGKQRLELLAAFTTIVCLLYASIHVTKEGLEHVLLPHEASEHDPHNVLSFVAGSNHGDSEEHDSHSSVSRLPSFMHPSSVLGSQEDDHVGVVIFITAALALSLHCIRSHGLHGRNAGKWQRSYHPRGRFSAILENGFALGGIVSSLLVGFVCVFYTSGPSFMKADRLVSLLIGAIMAINGAPAATRLGMLLLQTTPADVGLQVDQALDEVITTFNGHYAYEATKHGYEHPAAQFSIARCHAWVNGVGETVAAVDIRVRLPYPEAEVDIAGIRAGISSRLQGIVQDLTLQITSR
ncbi:hypothetical protein GQ42DRAFT_42540 [Ramicandelaber brevisporus]|nr:hypothetical protein GQ42DRAFT_42540 [Ramicandelaber brevisporus]